MDFHVGKDGLPETPPGSIREKGLRDSEIAFEKCERRIYRWIERDIERGQGRER